MDRWIDIQIYRSIDRKIDRYIDRQIDIQIDRQIDRLIDRYMNSSINGINIRRGADGVTSTQRESLKTRCNGDERDTTNIDKHPKRDK